MTSGIVTTMEAAIIEPHGCSNELVPLNCDMTTGTVFILSVTVKVRANKNSFHAAMNARSPVDTSPGIVSGNRICQNTVRGEAPSTYAASSSSFGRLRKYWVITQIVNGIVNIRYVITSPCRVLNRLSCFNMMNRPDSTEICGNIVIVSTRKSTGALNRNGRRPSAYAQMLPKASEINTVDPATMIELIKLPTNRASLNTA